MKIDAKKIIEDRLAASIGLDKYDRIMHTVYSVNVSEDAAFQRQFNGFYLVRRNAGWRKEYYKLFEMMKTEPLDFAGIITTLFKKTGNIEASFSSKMLATLNAGKPIWDHNVVRVLGLKLTGKSKQELLDNAVSLYSDIEKWYASFLCTENARECIVIFDRALPEYTWLSDVKKIDFFLWSIR